MHQDAPTFYFCLNTNSYSVVSNQKKSSLFIESLDYKPAVQEKHSAR